MKLNPIMALFDPLERLINEHGSAAILRDHVALFKDQLVILKEKFTNLETEKHSFETENQNLKTENAILKNKIQTYEKSLHDILLSETEVKILLFLAKQENIDITPEHVAQSLNINLQIITFHLQDLGAKKLVKDRPIAPFNFSLKRFWSLAQEGPRYLINHKLIS
jgi:FtsZ-binding cell division protein ZapB